MSVKPGDNIFYKRGLKSSKKSKNDSISGSKSIATSSSTGKSQTTKEISSGVHVEWSEENSNTGGPSSERELLHFIKL